VLIKQREKTPWASDEKMQYTKDVARDIGNIYNTK
jgi:hypothetical protein